MANGARAPFTLYTISFSCLFHFPHAVVTRHTDTVECAGRCERYTTTWCVPLLKWIKNLKTNPFSLSSSCFAAAYPDLLHHPCSNVLCALANIGKAHRVCVWVSMTTDRNSFMSAKTRKKETFRHIFRWRKNTGACLIPLRITLLHLQSRIDQRNGQRLK